jgi:predicted GTPase
MNCIIMGAAGRDFHDFLRYFRDRPELRVCCFTAHQIPFIEERSFPRELAGPNYESDIPIYSEERLTDLIDELDIDFVFLAYSDLAHEEVMHRASIVQAAGASFALLGPRHTQLIAERPVIAVTASRTGAGKSPLCQAIAFHLQDTGKRPGVIRHPMPYGDLLRQVVQRFATPDDLKRHDCTVEEREEYTPYVDRGLPIYAGVDYERILAEAQTEADVILWDGGNNDSPFIRPDLHITVLDALRPGHELAYYPGETNFRAADILVLNKVRSASPAALATLEENARRYNPSAQVIKADLEVELADPDAVAGKRVLVVEDGPTITHGGMPYGAAHIAAERFGAAEILDPRPHAVGTIAEAFAAYPHIGAALPALGYSESQRRELAETIRRVGPDLIIDGSPASLERALELDIPIDRVSYRFVQLGGRPIFELVEEALAP